MKNVPLWIRHVVVPGLTDGMDHLRRVKAKAESYPNFEKLEFLPFHKLCIDRAAGIKLFAHGIISLSCCIKRLIQ